MAMIQWLSQLFIVMTMLFMDAISSKDLSDRWASGIGRFSSSFSRAVQTKASETCPWCYSVWTYIAAVSCLQEWKTLDSQFNRGSFHSICSDAEKKHLFRSSIT